MQGQYLCQCLDIGQHDLFHAVEQGKMHQAIKTHYSEVSGNIAFIDTL